MKRIVLVTAVSAAAMGAGYGVAPDEFMQGLSVAGDGVLWLWTGIKANPVPVSLALGTFLLTVAYHKAKGKSLRESVEVAATRVAVVAVAAKESAEAENPVLARAKARATRSQLLIDQIALQNRQRKLPEEVQKAEKEACYTEQALADVQRKLVERRKSHGEAMTKLAALRTDKAACDAELAEIAAELQKLAQVA